MNLGLNSFWSDNATATGTSTSPAKKLISNNISLSHQREQEQQCQPQKLDDNELDIKEIVDHIWPCGDDSGIKLD